MDQYKTTYAYYPGLLVLAAIILWSYESEDDHMQALLKLKYHQVNGVQIFKSS